MALARFDSVQFDPSKLSRRTALRGLLRGELRRMAKLSPSPVANAFAGRSVGIRVARAIAKALDCEITELVAAEADEPAAA